MLNFLEFLMSGYEKKYHSNKQINKIIEKQTGRIKVGCLAFGLWSFADTGDLTKLLAVWNIVSDFEERKQTALANFTIDSLKSGGLITNYFCTSRCRHCLYNAGPHWEKEYIDPDTAEANLRVVRDLGCYRDHIGGGEPLLRPDDNSCNFARFVITSTSYKIFDFWRILYISLVVINMILSQKFTNFQYENFFIPAAL